MKIKICGITRPIEAEYLNSAGVDYAGFVFYEKSKRNISIEKAQEIFKVLDKKIKKVAVLVSPEVEAIEKLQSAGFDILQIHKELKTEVLEAAKLPVWYAVNISDEAEAEEKQKFLDTLPEELKIKVAAVVVDAPNFGSGQTFDWHRSKRMLKAGTNSPPDRMFILAGGLRPENVGQGIELFRPDVVDVSSGVEGTDGKDPELINKFTQAVHIIEGDIT